MSTKPQNYILCATPRTGSTHLCSLLKSSGVAGVPESYWRSQDIDRWARHWGINQTPADCGFHQAYLAAMLKVWRTENGVGGLRVMWETMDEITTALRPLFPDHADTDHGLIREAFGEPRFIYLERRDRVAQAVSRLKAEQADIWHMDDVQRTAPPADAYRYDHEQLRGFVEEADTHNIAWQQWFDAQNITPYHIVYEDLCADPPTAIHGLLAYLSVPPNTAQPLRTKNQKMADALSAEWIARYNDEQG